MDDFVILKKLRYMVITETHCKWQEDNSTHPPGSLEPRQNLFRGHQVWPLFSDWLPKPVPTHLVYLPTAGQHSLVRKFFLRLDCSECNTPPHFQAVLTLEHSLSSMGLRPMLTFHLLLRHHCVAQWEAAKEQIHEVVSTLHGLHQSIIIEWKLRVRQVVVGEVDLVILEHTHQSKGLSHSCTFSRMSYWGYFWYVTRSIRNWEGERKRDGKCNTEGLPTDLGGLFVCTRKNLPTGHSWLGGLPAPLHSCYSKWSMATLKLDFPSSQTHLMIKREGMKD